MRIHFSRFDRTTHIRQNVFTRRISVRVYELICVTDHRDIRIMSDNENLPTMLSTVNGWHHLMNNGFVIQVVVRLINDERNT